MDGHFIIKCSCGTAISQCRCPALDKTIKTVQRGCDKCRAEDDAARPHEPYVGVHMTGDRVRWSRFNNRETW